MSAAVEASGLWSRLWSRLGGRRSAENPAVPLSAATVQSMWGAGDISDAGIVVSRETVMRIAAVYRCVAILSGALGQLPLVTYRRTDRGKVKAIDTPQYQILAVEPNAEMTPLVWKETGQAHLCLRGNAYSRIEQTYGGRPLALWPLDPDRVRVERVAGRLVYRVRLEGGGSETLDPSEIVHVPALTTDGLVGFNPIEVLRQPVGIAASAEATAATLFRDGIRGSGVLIAKGVTDDGELDRLIAKLQQQYAGKLHRALVVGGDADWKPLTINPDDAQFLDTRKFQVTEIARIFGIPPHMVGDVEKSTSWGTGIEQQSIGFVIYVLGPWLVRWEQELARKLFTSAERREQFVKFNLSALVRGDMKARYDSYQVAIQNGWLSPNDVLELEDMNTFEGGDVHLQPLNMAPVGSRVNEIVSALRDGAIPNHDEVKRTIAEALGLALPAEAYAKQINPNLIQRAFLEDAVLRVDELRQMVGLEPLGGDEGARFVKIGGDAPNNGSTTDPGPEAPAPDEEDAA